ncbi:hypothetical protein [Lewinella sp. W8]|uniref:hypothetical protein n=1 Tax=Lewinella sp. W8 TaxID=2528208 RepID=UPI001067C682|nr:hypothetical protein [Lewinella sp. W8]MTB53108.1 hypothetical protein [Lewinella sp. W8]
MMLYRTSGCVRGIMLIACLSLSVHLMGQKQSLRDQLWERVNPCFSNFEDMDDDGKPDFDQIDDARNGYLHVSGGWPTCGCSCASTVGAYRNDRGEYTLLQMDEANCSWDRKLSSNRDIWSVLPEEFGLKDFVGRELALDLDDPTFFLSVEIPRKGTDTEVSLKLIPLGLELEAAGPIVTEYGEGGNISQHQPISEIATFARSLSDDEALTSILNGDFAELAEVDKRAFSRLIGDSYGQFATEESLRETLQRLRDKYELYFRVKYQKIVLGWDRQQSRFFVKKRVPAASGTKSFRQFLIEAEYWAVMC